MSTNSNGPITTLPANGLNTDTLQMKVKSYAGFVNVDEKRGDHLFYWFFESRNAHLLDSAQQSEIPLVVWLTGGPGASSLIALFKENGPLHLGDNDPTTSVIPHPAGWNEETHIIYWDQPVGTGFSYSDTDHYVNNEEELAEQFYTALQAFYDLHGYRECPLYITGESYAGKYIPNIANTILAKNAQGEPEIPLKALAIGDGWISPEVQTYEQIQYAFQLGFLDIRQKNQVMKQFRVMQGLLKEDKYIAAKEVNDEIVNRILVCGGNPDIYDVRSWQSIDFDTLIFYLNQKSVQKAMGLSKFYPWVANYDVAKHLAADFMVDAAPLLPPLLEQLPILLYSGNFDMSAGYTGTERMLYDLDWSYQKEWRRADRKVWILPPDRTLGYIKQTDNLTLVGIVGAGHLVPLDKPWVSRFMLYNWIFDRPFLGTIPPPWPETKKPKKSAD